jgi:C1A family cysteine protease
VNIGVDDDFYDWGDHRVSSNIYHGPGNTTLSHSVVIVGYDHDDLGDLYWIVKNSWGPAWGDRGYIFISAAANDGFVGPAGVAGILTSGILVESETY